MATKLLRTAAPALLALLLGAARAPAAPGDFVASFGEGILDNPLNLNIAGNGNLYVCDYGNGDVKVFGPGHALLASFGQLNPDREYPQYPLFLNPHSLAVHGERVYVANSGHRRLEVFSLGGAPLGEIANPLSLPWGPSGLAADAAGNLVVSDFETFQAYVLGPDGAFLRWIDGGGRIVAGGVAALDSAGSIYLPRTEPAAVAVFAADGSPLRTISGDFDWPTGVAVDRNGRTYVSDFVNHRIQVFDAAGGQLAVWVSPLAGAMTPTGLTLDEDAGRLYVCDMWNSRIQIFEAFPTSGDGGACLDAFAGFLPPVSLDRPVPLTSTLPVKFVVAADRGCPLELSGYAVSLRQGARESAGTATPPAAAGGPLHFNVGTRGFARGAAELEIALPDGSRLTRTILLQ